ncbi:MAG: flagellar export protein FliJ [Phycisphaerales bacterium]
MARFRFRLQAVLDHREAVEQERQRAVAEVERERVRLEGVIRECHRRITVEKGEQRRGLLAGDLGAARRQASAGARYSTEAQRAAIELAGAYARLERARAALLEAAKARKAVELLRERHLEQWRAEESRRENAAADELSVMRAGRKEAV